MKSTLSEQTVLHPYAAQVLTELQVRIPWEVEFLQAVQDVFESITPLLETNPRYQRERLLERIVEPERVIAFPVVWTDDRNEVHVNRGYRVQFNSALGPYKGGTRFHASVGLGGLKALGFEQTLKNALTGLPLGGGKGGADLSTRGLSDNELRRFCQAYMTELVHHIGPQIDVPGGDIGVGTREIGYLFGHYKRLTRSFSAALTGKASDWGGSKLRPEATGFGVGYFVDQVLQARGEGLAGKTVAISGFGNVAWGAAKKITELGGRVVTLSGPDGFVLDPAGLDDERIEFMRVMRSGGRDAVKQYAEQFGVEFFPGERPWAVPCDVAVPCAIQGELMAQDAHRLVEQGCRVVVEGANMPATQEAWTVFRAANLCVVPGKAANAGGVAVSSLEMTQNRLGEVWAAERVDQALRQTMTRIHAQCLASAEQCGKPGDYAIGANVAGFSRVAEAVLDQGTM